MAKNKFEGTAEQMNELLDCIRAHSGEAGEIGRVSCRERVWLKV